MGALFACELVRSYEVALAGGNGLDLLKSVGYARRWIIAWVIKFSSFEDFFKAVSFGYKFKIYYTLQEAYRTVLIMFGSVRMWKVLEGNMVNDSTTDGLAGKVVLTNISVSCE